MPSRAAPLILLLAACSHAPDPPRAARSEAGQDAGAVFSREALAAGTGQRSQPAGDAGADEPPVPASADPAALAEILAAAPSALPRDGDVPRPLLGSDTGVPADAGPAADRAAAERPRGAQITIGKVVHEPGAAGPAIERAARAQLYWPLVQRCREDAGAALPPETVHLRFLLDREGYVVPASILAVPAEPRFADAARCMARELSMVGFRGPSSVRGVEQSVTMDVPSVD